MNNNEKQMNIIKIFFQKQFVKIEQTLNEEKVERFKVKLKIENLNVTFRLEQL